MISQIQADALRDVSQGGRPGLLLVGLALRANLATPQPLHFCTGRRPIGTFALPCQPLVTVSPLRLRRLPACHRITALQHYGMTYTLPVSKRGTLTLPPELRRRLKLDQVASPLVIVEERDGGLFLQSAVAMPIRDIPKATIRQWVLNDEADAKALKAFRRKK